MKETPLIYSTDNVRRVLKGLKTQTRRTTGLKEINKEPDRWVKAEPIPQDRLLYAKFKSIWRVSDKDGNILIVKCPYGGVGDMLWVRETHLSVYPEITGKVIYRADCDYKDEELTPVKEGHVILKWQPSIFMFKKDARIWLENTEQPRLERVQDITEEDAIREGIQIAQGTWQKIDINNHKLIGEPQPYTARYHYEAQWDELHGEGAWDKNEWVWVVTHNAFGVRLK